MESAPSRSRKKRTFLDAGILIAAARGEERVAESALAIIDDPEREFVASDFLRLELLPKPVFNKREMEAAFYRIYFDSTAVWVKASPELAAAAEAEAEKHGLGAMDALHVAAAVAGGAEELVTSEGPTKPIHRATGVRIVHSR